jgi:hypothetical protein
MVLCLTTSSPLAQTRLTFMITIDLLCVSHLCTISQEIYCMIPQTKLWLCNTLYNPWTDGTYSWQHSRFIYCLHGPTRVFCVHFVLTPAHPRKLPGRSPILIALSQARLTWRFFRDRLPKKKMHLVGMDILLSLGLGYHHPRCQDITIHPT